MNLRQIVSYFLFASTNPWLEGLELVHIAPVFPVELSLEGSPDP